MNVIIVSKHRGTVHFDTDRDPCLPAGTGRLSLVDPAGNETGVVLNAHAWADLRAHINAVLGTGRPPVRTPIEQAELEQDAVEAGMDVETYLERQAAVAAVEARGRQVALHGLVMAAPRRRGHGRRHDRSR